MKTSKPAGIDEYISRFPKHVQTILEEVRSIIKKSAPEAEETIKYDMPTFTLNGNLVYFAAFKNHIGFYPAPTNDEAFSKDLSPYKTGKGSVQFPLDQPMPEQLIRKIVKWQIERNALKAAKKKGRK
ncbi:MAG: DUF1801 domain-containing protein [Sphingobacteriales bacterium]|nr:DUF1801 domain-containing protein [Sphingobacteriales bacterium]OJW04082.1 MAG: hypothetical protein BGO52_17105 [Sphingobacteriales bacterium 44-61]